MHFKCCVLGMQGYWRARLRRRPAARVTVLLNAPDKKKVLLTFAHHANGFFCSHWAAGDIFLLLKLPTQLQIGS